MPAPPRLAPYVTLKEVARLMGWGVSRNAQLRFTRRLLAKQRLTGQEFILKLGPAEHSPWMTTLPMLKRHCPELFDRPAEALDMLAEASAALRAEIAELKALNQRLRGRIAELERKVKALEAPKQAA